MASAAASFDVFESRAKHGAYNTRLLVQSWLKDESGNTIPLSEDLDFDVKARSREKAGVGAQDATKKKLENLNDAGKELFLTLQSHKLKSVRKHDSISKETKAAKVSAAADSKFLMIDSSKKKKSGGDFFSKIRKKAKR